MKVISLVFFFLILVNFVYLEASEKLNIIKSLNKIDNIKFGFIQTTNNTVEKGICILSFPQKLKCNYDDKDQKELIVNKTLMAITQRRYNKTLIYPMSKSNFIKILNKNELISVIKSSSLVTDDYHKIIFNSEENSKTTINFEKSNFLLAGWVTSDQFNNTVAFKIKIISINENVDEKIFKIPKKS